MVKNFSQLTNATTTFLHCCLALTLTSSIVTLAAPQRKPSSKSGRKSSPTRRVIRTPQNPASETNVSPQDASSSNTGSPKAKSASALDDIIAPVVNGNAPSKSNAEAMTTNGAVVAGASEASSTEAATTEAASTEAVSEEAPKDKLETLRAEAEEATTDAERGRIQLAIADELIDQNRAAEALEELRTFIASTRFDPTGYYNAGNRLVNLGDTASAISAYRKAIEQRRGNYARALNNLGVLLIRQADLTGAEDALRRAIQQQNNAYAEASYNLGRLYTLRGDMKLAEREWKRAYRLEPDHIEAAVALARLYSVAGESEKALAIIDRARPANEAARNSLSQAREDIVRAAALVRESKKGSKKQASKLAS